MARRRSKSARSLTDTVYYTGHRFLCVTEAQVTKIQALWIDKRLTQKAIANRFSISAGTVSRVVNSLPEDYLKETELSRAYKERLLKRRKKAHEAFLKGKKKVSKKPVKKKTRRG